MRSSRAGSVVRLGRLGSRLATELCVASRCVEALGIMGGDMS